jgi:hypothetical protein
LDAIESSVVGEKGGDLAEENCENKDNINGAGGGGVVEEGGNWVNEDANPQNYQGNGDGGSKHRKDEDTQKKVSSDGNNRNSVKNDEGGEEVEAEDGKKEKFPRPIVANLIQPFINSPNLDQSYKNTSKKSSVYDVTKSKQIQKGEEEEVHL